MEHTDYSESIEKSKKYIRLHCSENLCAEQICDNVGYSVYHFSRIFKKHSGKTLMQYVRDVRLENAVKEFKKGKKMCDVAEKCGYGTVGGFTRAYKKKYGEKP